MDKSTMLLQRRILGILCLLLGPCCLIFGLLGENLPQWYCSISATYYANSKIFMIGLLFATSIFFFSYRGYDRRDRILTLVQGVSSLGIIVFPCATPGIYGKVGLLMLPVDLSHVVHCISALILFISFGVMIRFLFTRGANTRRNLLYKICGDVIFTFVIIHCLMCSVDGRIPFWFPYTMINEIIMLTAFGLAWLVKSKR